VSEASSKKKAQSIDTNVLLRATVDEAGLEAQCHAARAIIASDNHDVAISDVTIAEYIHALESHYRLDRATICTMVLTVVRMKNVRCSLDVIISALTYFASKPKLSFDDCFIAEQARANQAVPLWTFDKKLANQHDVAALVHSSE